ncbi:MAG TPA: methyltransferase domain-containing protein [Myxococcaceae bacterium]|nr:methyltransferase domain-containing protein [Myxococcaceae bacterium]
MKGTHLAEEYQRQGRWRRWDQILELVPFREGERVLDLGCGVGDVTERLHRRGLQVVGIDANEELLQEARLRHPSVRFENLDLTDLAPATFGRVDGIWASFVAAYFTNLDEALSRWRDCLVPGGWISLVEVDDLLGHTPLPVEIGEQVRAFYDEARVARRYDFECGRRLGQAMEGAGFRLLTEQVVPDDELSFDGPASEQVLVAWRQRLDRMMGLKAFFGDGFPEFKRTFLAALASADHRSKARVFAAVARNS